MSLADQIIEHGHVEPGDDRPGWFGRLTAAGINELRDELIAARALKELLTSGRFTVDAVYSGDLYVTLECNRPDCPWVAEPDTPADLAELVQRAGEHAEVCR